MRIACLVTKDFEDSEVSEPTKALQGAGHEVVIISPSNEPITGKHGQVSVRPDATIDGVVPGEFDALYIPGGYSPDKLRADRRFVEFVEEFDALERPILAICHGPQLLLTAGVLRGRTVTAWKTVQDDLRRAGIHVLDQPAVRDENLITSRMAADLPAFIDAVIDLLQETAAAGDTLPVVPVTAPTLH